MDMKRFFLYAIAIAALALAGCGGGGGMAGGGNGNGNGGETPTNGFVIAHKARASAAEAAMAAAAAVMAAMEASGNLDVLSVKGDSMTAQMNAQTVLDQQGFAVEALMAAKTALKNAEDALGAVTANTANATEVTAALEAAVMDAKAQVKLAEDAAEGMDLETAVAAVTDDDDMPMTAKIGEGVAMDIGMALLPDDNNGAGERVTHGTILPMMSTDPEETAVKENDAQGMTWEEIVGSDNVMKMRIAATGGTEEVDAASFAGMALGSITENVPMDGDEVADGTEYVTANYKGVDGTVFCAGSDCKVEDGKLTGSWYFTPEDGDESYVETEDGMGYKVDTLYARFGHWLSVSNGDYTVNTYAMSPTSERGALGVSDMLDMSATYKGDAVGMSVHKTFDGNNLQTGIDSGAFTAAVTLEATFGDTPMLEGTVDGFGGPATDSKWAVELKETAFTGGTFNNGVTDATGDDGVWSATSYGAAGARPTGIFGGFNAHFTDGHAAGAYATREE